MTRAGRMLALSLFAAAMIALLLILLLPPIVRADTGVGVVSPKAAAAGATIEVSVDQCFGVPAATVHVTFQSALLVDWRPEDLHRFPVREGDHGYRLEAPPLPAGPYHVLIECGGEAFGFSDEGAGPIFWITAPQQVGDTFAAFLFYPCDPLAGGEASWADPRVLLGPTTDIAEPGDERLVPATIVRHADWGSDGFIVDVRVPPIAPGAYFVYTDCASHFALQDPTFVEPPLPWLTVVPDTSTAPRIPNGARDDRSAPVVPLLAGLLAGLLVVATGREPRRAS
ncbi:MAG TPA: hypothetical protein VFX65_08945 [Candidatus Limnocylindrales bacterium]|nr:hypothetical protein [Candidatus Limnocylindrales bacterium]